MQTQHLILKGRIPSKKNSKFLARRGSRTYLLPSPKFTEWHKIAVDQINQPNPTLIENISSVQLEFYMPDNRRADLTNKAESVMDLLVDCQVIEDDRWQIVSSLYMSSKGIDKENPRCEIWIQSTST